MNNIENTTGSDTSSAADELAVEVEGEDSSISVEGYGITDITVRKLAKESFRAKFAFHVSFRSLQDVLADGGKVFGLRKTGLLKDGPIEVVFTIHIAKNTYNCNNVYFSDAIPTDARARITRAVRLEVARLALSANCHDNYFLGAPLPELVKEVGGPNWGAGIAFGLLYAFCFNSSVSNYPTSIALGICIGLAMAYALRSVKYHFGKKTV
ncbi:MAG: hypothetical protein IK125_00935 [Lachnospiraceae bacterium]|nr:hypothetical protein [Lachnospiraceae bacterium]